MAKCFADLFHKIGTFFQPILLLYSLCIVLLHSTNPTMATPQIFRAAEEGLKLVGSNTNFALILLKQLAKEQSENVFMSPASISIAMAMTFMGARGKSAEELGQVMGYNKVAESELHKCFADLREALHKTENKFQLHTANRLFAEKTYNFLEEYLLKTKEHYAAELSPVDFVKATEEARQEINKWVEGQTNNKICDLIPDGAIDDLTRLILVNAIYFKGDWDNKFDPSTTNEADFHVSKDEKIKVPLMYKKDNFRYGLNRNLECQAVELPYVDRRLSLFVLLPDPREGVDVLLSKIQVEDLTDVEKNFKMFETKVEVYLPRFKLEQSFSLGKTMAALGIKEIFTDQADLSGVDGTRELYVTKVLHKAFIEVNEEGSEAAAATAVVMGLRSMPRVFELRADHPFVFMIRDNTSRTILFLGKVVRPEPAAAPGQAPPKQEL